MPPILPRAHGEHRFPIKVRRTTVAPWSSRRPPSAVAEVQNEGTPFRCLGPHTLRKPRRKRGLVSARTPCNLQPSFCRVCFDYSSTARQHRQAKDNSQNLPNITIDAPNVKPLARLWKMLDAHRDAGGNNLSERPGFQPSLGCSQAEVPGCLPKGVHNFYTDGFP